MLRPEKIETAKDESSTLHLIDENHEEYRISNKEYRDKMLKKLVEIGYTPKTFEDRLDPRLRLAGTGNETGPDF